MANERITEYSAKQKENAEQRCSIDALAEGRQDEFCSSLSDISNDFFEIPSTTPNFRTELAAQLAELIPEAVADGKLDVEKLRELLADDGADSNERFGLFWPGKKRALRAAQAPTTATLKPDLANSKEWDTTQNAFIEGDNLEVLKILQRHYHNKVKLIYIDPPYNTGNDFVYPDNYREGLDTYLEWTRQVNEEGKKVSTNSETEGRYHSNWLNMMYPRLKLARNLLTDDGVIFISIDDHEQDNLKKLCNEVFGERNFIAQLVWEKKKKGAFLSESSTNIKEYVFVYSRSVSNFNGLIGEIARNVETYPVIKTTNSRGVRLIKKGIPSRFKSKNHIVPSGSRISSGNMEMILLSDLVIKDGFLAEDVKVDSNWIYSQKLLDSYADEKSLYVTQDLYFRRIVSEPREKKLKDLLPMRGSSSSGANFSISDDLFSDGWGTNEDAFDELHAIFGLQNVMSFPKPTKLLAKLFLAASRYDPDCIVLDFFAGSATTAHAVMQLNAEDNGKRRFIMVQLPEPTPEASEARKAGFATIADISRKRIELAGEKIKSDVAESNIDTGFRAYKLTDTNFTKWRVTSDIEPDKLTQHLLDLRGSSVDDASPDDLLTELLLKLGYSLNEHLSMQTIAGLDIHAIAGDTDKPRLLAYLNERTKPTLEQLRELVNTEPTRLIVLEDAFHGDDELKTNIAQYARSKGIELRTA
ncbi:adenine methyltransferase [Pectobacterium carotovorum subsp. carotovorum]|uniref:site-specific DNA-methyltransferase (adenine-specific) n=2 Tax=Pectobacterium versatile TaxID=2488639 RepID=A0ABU8JZ23_9GAMM|nr:site-specific DNA-methyltransferase [Pectobacterium versatile]UCP80813.1 site-specific DNA-methyltransferase [Pectobacterium versatile]GKW32872.1 adenine methyltransferase [Pectobacterium carotovorum subsp. carotovorum]